MRSSQLFTWRRGGDLIEMPQTGRFSSFYHRVLLAFEEANCSLFAIYRNLLT
jgi:hypothetical protein